MTTHRNEDHVDPSAEPRQAGSDAGLSADRPLGYGHRAYRPDPNASYGFEPGPSRILPEDQRRRWRVPG